MFNLRFIDSLQVSQSVSELTLDSTLLLFPYSELARVVPDQLNEYQIDKKIERESVHHEGWNGSFFTLNLRNNKIPPKDLLVNGVLCVNENDPKKPVFWFDLNDYQITEIQCFQFISTCELAMVFLQEKGKGKKELLEVLASSI
jgi:hypothetical protein